MIEKTPENQISDLFQGLPRKSWPRGDKKRVWFKIENYIAATREPEAGLLHFLFLRKTWSKAVAIIVMVLIAVSIVGGAARATPGETLYGVKKAAEKMEKVLASTQEAKVKVTIKHAKRRLEEVQILVAQDHKNGIVSETLNALTNTTQDAVAASESRPELKDQILELTTHEEKVLVEVQTQVEGAVREAVDKALTLTKESLNKLISEDQVRGATTLDDAQSSAREKATSTIPETISKPQSKPKETSTEGLIQSEIQIDQIIKGSDIE